MDEKIFSQFKTVPLRQPIAVKGLHTWPNLYKYILEELERCAKHPSYLSMFKESPTDTNPFNTSTFDIIRDRLKGTDTHLDIVSGELVLNTNKFHYKEDSLNKNTLYKLQWDFKSYNTLKDIKIPEFFELMESNKNKYISFKEQFGNFNLVPVGLNPSLYDLRIAKANKKRINGLCNILEKIENLYKTTYVDFTNSISEQLLQNNIQTYKLIGTENFDICNLRLDTYIGEEGLIDIIKNIGEYIWEKIKKIGNFFKELFSKVIKLFKKILFGIEEKKVAEKLEKIPEQKLTESINNLKKYLETKKLTIVPLNDTDELLVLFKQMCNNIPKVLETSFELSKTSIAGEKTSPLLKLLIDKGVIQIPSNIHENTKKLLLGQTDKLGIEVQGEKLLTIVSGGKLSLDNITKANIKEKYNDIITLFKTQITLMEDKYLPLINSLTENKNTLSELQKVAAKYTEDNGISKNDKKAFYQTQTAIIQFVSTFLFAIPRILQSSIIKLVSFYNEFIKIFVKEFSKEDNSIKEVLLKLKEPKIQQQLLKDTPVFKVIDGIKVYRYRDIAKKLNSIDPTLKMAMWQAPVGAWCTISALGTNYYAMIGDLDKLLSTNELDAIVYHELGHAKYSHIVSYIDKVMLQVLKGKMPDPTRNIQDEIQADSYAVEHTSLDTTISALKKVDAYYQKSIGSSVIEKQRFEYLALWKKNNSKPDIKEFLKNK